MADHRRVALITGATSGIGAAYANRFARQGFDLILTGRREEKIRHFAKTLRFRYNIGVNVTIAEFAWANHVEILVRKIESTPNLHVLVNNAGFTTKKEFHEEDISRQLDMVSVHILASMRLTHAAVPVMIRNNSGTIINVSSMGAFAPLAENATYSAAKVFLKNFSESLHMSLNPHGIKVQALFPGFTRTDLGRGLGIDMHTKEDTGFQKWMCPEYIVDISIKALTSRRQVLCIPGRANKINYLFLRTLPRSIWYRLEPFFRNRMP